MLYNPCVTDVLPKVRVSSCTSTNWSNLCPASLVIKQVEPRTMTYDNPTPTEVFDLAAKVAGLLRALLYHPGTAFVGDQVTDPQNTHVTLFNVTDFVKTTYLEYLIPLLPPGATRSSRALTNPWRFREPDFQENPDAMAENKYPKVKGNQELLGKWQDANSRAIMIGTIIADPKKQEMFGGSFDFGKAVYECAEELYKPK